MPLEMVVQVVDAACQPLAGARVDISHRDAAGNYPGFAEQGSDAAAETSAETFLRGTQMAEEQGVVSLRTIYPGRHRGRTTHIHHKVFLDETDVLTGRIVLPDALSQLLFDDVAACAREGVRDTVHGDDGHRGRGGRGRLCRRARGGRAHERPRGPSVGGGVAERAEGRAPAR